MIKSLSEKNQNDIKDEDDDIEDADDIDSDDTESTDYDMDSTPPPVDDDLAALVHGPKSEWWAAKVTNP